LQHRIRISRLVPARLARAGNRRLAVVAGVLLAVVAAPIALAGPIQGGQRNPSPNPSVSYTQQTQIIADNTTWGTRQSNKGTGGGAIYGCRSASGANPCIEGDNLTGGQAFRFITGGTVGGTITLANKTGAPLTTNATGVATGFNANFLQGKQATDFLGVTAQAADSAKLAGQPATNYAQTSQLLFAAVSANGTLGNTRGATSAAQTSVTNKTYTVTFSADVSKCSYTASPVGAALTSGSIGVAPDTTLGTVVDVTAPAALPQGFELQVIC
jgi:hypothetical protein